jgi:hypothetical protein
MMSIRIRVAESRQAAFERRAETPLAAEWMGAIDWPTAPRPGVDHWVHCGDWSAEEIHMVFFYGPPPVSGPVGNGKPGVTIEVRTEADVIAHLIADHGFTGGNA